MILFCTIHRAILFGMCCAIAIASLTAPALAAESSEIVITADSAEVSQQDESIVYAGSVVIAHEDFELRAERVEYVQTKDNRLFKSFGSPVKVFWTVTGAVNQLNNARAEMIEYSDGRTRTLDMSGNAYIEVDNDSLESEKIHYNFDTELLKATGSQQRQVRFVITDRGREN